MNAEQRIIAPLWANYVKLVCCIGLLLLKCAAWAQVRYGSEPPPAPGIHPRICLTPKEIPLLQTRIKNSPAREAFAGCEGIAVQLLNPKSLPAAVVSRLENGTGSVSEAEKQQLSDTIREAAFVSLVTPKPDLVLASRTALLTFVRHIPPKSITDLSRVTMGIALAYDWLFSSFADIERQTIRRWLALTCSIAEERLDQQTTGFRKGEEAKRNMNWVPFTVGAFGVTALAIEGEAGYRSVWYDKAVASMENFLDHGIREEGAPVETIHYFAYGMANGAVFLDAMARRGHALWNHPHLRKIPLWWTYDLLPWGRDFNSLADTRDLHTGMGEIYYRLALAYPDDPVMQWVYKNYTESENGAQLSPFTAALWMTPAVANVTAASLKLPLSRYFAQNGLAYLRSGWGNDDTYFEFQSDPIPSEPLHAHADRNSFTLMSKGRVWALDRGYHYNRGIDHNLVQIDGKSEGVFPHVGRILAYQDNDWATGIAGDATQAYRWKVELQGTAGTRSVSGLAAREYNPVSKAYRSGTLVRGKHPYVLIADDIQKDAQTHEYAWQMLTPLSNRVETLDAKRVLLKPVDSGSAVGLNGSVGFAQQEPLKVAFDIKKAGSYHIFLLMGREPWTSWTYGGFLTLDQGAAVRFLAKEGDNAQTHWQKITLDKQSGGVPLTPGRHEIAVQAYGSVRFAAMMVAPTNFDPVQPTEAAFPPDCLVHRFAEANSLPKGWSRVVAETHEPRLLVQVISPAEVRFQSDLLHNPREDDKQTTDGTVVRLRATATTKAPKFRVLLYPHRAGDPLPRVETRGDVVTVTWLDGIQDTWEFSQKGTGGSTLDAAVILQRKSGQNIQTLRLVW